MGGSERSGGSDHDRAGANVGRHGNSRSSRPRQPPGDLQVDPIDRSIDRSKQRSFFTRSVFSSGRHAAAQPSLITTPAFSRNISLSGVNSNEEQNKSVAAISRFESRSVCSLTARIDPARQLLFPVAVAVAVAVAIAIAFLIPPSDYTSSQKRISRLFRGKSHSAIDQVALDPYRLYYLCINTIPST